MKIVFFGTPDFAEKSLEGLYEAGYDIAAVVTNVDKPKGRGMKFVPSAVKEFAIKHEIKVFQPVKIKNNEEFIESIKNIAPDIICVVAYGKILPKEVLDIPKYGCINVHGSLLPKYRGAAPIQWAVINGDKVTGITTMYMAEGMDTGDMILKKEVEIGDDETTGELWNRLSNEGAELLIKTIKLIENGKPPREKQGDDFSLAPMLSKEMAKIDWKNKNAVEIKNLIRGLNPIMGAYSFLNGKKIKFWRADVISNEELEKKFTDMEDYKNRINRVSVGTVLFSDSKNGLYIKAKEGIISILEIQGENSKKMEIDAFLRGNKIEAGAIFE